MIDTMNLYDVWDTNKKNKIVLNENRAKGFLVTLWYSADEAYSLEKLRTLCIYP
jgi:hypothetical protein